MQSRSGSVEIIVAALVIVAIVAGVWLYLGRNHWSGSSSPESQPLGQTQSESLTNPVQSPQGTSSSTASNPNDPTSQYTLFRPSGAAAQVLGTPGSQFKIQYIAYTTIKSPGGWSSQRPFFNQYFFNPESGESWQFTMAAADGSGFLKAVVVSFDEYSQMNYPWISMTYPVVDPDTGSIDNVKAQLVLPDDGSYFNNSAGQTHNTGMVTFTAVGSIHPTGRIVFAVPTEATSATLTYPGGTLFVDLANQTITANVTPRPATTTAPVAQFGPVTVTSAPLSWYTQFARTYTDSTGAFSVQYPGEFAPDTSVNGDGGSYLDNALVDFSDSHAPAFTIAHNVNGSVDGFDVEYSSPVDPIICENPGNESQNETVPPTIVNGVNWYRATILSNNGTPYGGKQGIDDVYQTMQGGKCWAFDFTWVASANQSSSLSAIVPSYEAVSIFEESILGTFRVLDPSVLPDTGSGSGN